MKHQRLDHSRLAEVLHEQGIGNVDAIRELLQHSQEGGMPFCEALVTTNLITDWDLSKVICDTFQLPFLPVDMVEPNKKAMEGLDPGVFTSNQIIPLDRFGQVLTVIMPGVVQADVLAMISAATDLVILPVVGTVETNRRWVTENLRGEPAPDIEGGWSNLFDQADAEVNASLDGGDSMFGAPEPLTADEQSELTAAGDDDLSFEEPAASGDLDLNVLGDMDGLETLEAEAPDEDALAMDPDLSTAASLGADDFDLGLGGVDDDAGIAAPDPGGEELPPMPDFGERKAG